LVEEELARNRLLVEAMASGKLEIRSWQDGHGMVDTTADSLAQAKLRVARLKEILATYSWEGRPHPDVRMVGRGAQDGGPRLSSGGTHDPETPAAHCHRIWSLRR
jgi:hypothetical protein